MKTQIAAYCQENKTRLAEILTDLVRIPSENRAPYGSEESCQNYVKDSLNQSGFQPVSYLPTQVAELETHPLFWPGRSYENRPNVVGKRSGSGNGRSLLLSGHIDTVPAGSQPWTTDPFSGKEEGNLIYGRGSMDMKSGIAINLFIAEALNDLGIELQGDLTIESVVDEEFGGVNGTLAGRVRGDLADAAIITEPSSGRICPAQRGGRTVHLTFRAPNKGILSSRQGAGVVDQLRIFLNALPEFEKIRSISAPAHPAYAHLENPVPVTVARIQTAPWGTSEPPNVPPVCQLELFWQTMPGESLDVIDTQFNNWFDSLLSQYPEVFQEHPQIEYPIRWLSASAISEDEPLVQEFTKIIQKTTGIAPLIQGIEGPCDMYVFHTYGVPAILWGAHGANAHMPDEYVELDSMVNAAEGLLHFVCHWCGIQHDKSDKISDDQ